MNIKLSEPVVISRGPSYEQCGWGPYQFPHMHLLDDGRIVCIFADSPDTIDAYGAECACFVSADKGRSWQRSRFKEFELLVGLKLDNGDRLQFMERDSIKVTDDMVFPEPVVSNKGTTYYSMEEISESIIGNKTWLLHRVNADCPEGREEPVVLNWPHMTVRRRGDIIIPNHTWGTLRKAPDGTLWMPNYATGLNPYDGSFSPHDANYLFCSKDNGKTWDLKHYLPFAPDPVKDPNSPQYEGYNENDIAFAPDGSYVRLSRSNGTNPLCKGPCVMVRSTDKGETWSDPVAFADRGVWPRLCVLPCGVTLASYGRPGFYIRATDDPSCQVWEDPVELIHVAEGENPWRATCGYSDLIPLDNHTAAVAYTDFKIRDDEGNPRKTVLFRTITVE